MPDIPDTKDLDTLFIELQSVDSTNNYARKQIQSVNQSPDSIASIHGTAYFAHEQTQGKGQQGRPWISEPEKNIALSLVLDTPSSLVQFPFYLSACIAVSVCEFFRQYAGDDTRVKWPNDLYWKNRKAGGILIESGVRSDALSLSKGHELEASWAIAGIGININQTNFPADLSNPVSLKQITGKDHDPVQLAKELHRLVMNNYNSLLQKDFEKIFKAYNANLYGLEKLMKFKKDNRVFEGRIKMVSAEGKLIVMHTYEEEFDSISYLSIK